MAREEKNQQQTTERQLNRLPGENGFHARDGSLTKKKREQWEEEKGWLVGSGFKTSHSRSVSPPILWFKAKNTM